MLRVNEMVIPTSQAVVSASERETLQTLPLPMNPDTRSTLGDHSKNSSTGVKQSRLFQRFGPLPTKPDFLKVLLEFRMRIPGSELFLEILKNCLLIVKVFQDQNLILCEVITGSL